MTTEVMPPTAKGQPGAPPRERTRQSRVPDPEAIGIENVSSVRGARCIDQVAPNLSLSVIFTERDRGRGQARATPKRSCP
jgi:hypothetical protein